MPIDTAAFRVPAGEKVKLARRPTQVPAFYRDKADYQDLLTRHVRRMAERLGPFLLVTSLLWYGWYRSASRASSRSCSPTRSPTSRASRSAPRP